MLPKRRVPDVANQDGGQQVPSAMTVDTQLVRLQRRRTRGVIVRPRYRQACVAGAEASHTVGAGREPAQRPTGVTWPIPTRRFPGIVLLVRWEQSAEYATRTHEERS